MKTPIALFISKKNAVVFPERAINFGYLKFSQPDTSLDSYGATWGIFSLW